MAEIKPFRGLRYASGVGPLADLVTPPYDVIDAKAQDDYYRRHPYNIIRLEYGKVYPGDDESNNRYTRAAADFTAWREKGVLVPEESPALYLYEQEFSAGGKRLVRSGMICAVKLEPYEKGVVLPHEETLPKHKEDRLALMRACRANFSPIFGLYADEEMTVDNLLRPRAGRSPDLDFTDENGHAHRLWVITDPAVIEQVRQAMAGSRIFIADGHHRYETALAYSRERRQEEGNPAGPGPYDYVMMTLVNLYDPGLVVLPTHRLVRNVEGLDVEELLGKIQEHFEIEVFPLAPGYGNFYDFIKELATRGGFTGDARPGAGPLSHRHSFGLYCGSGRLYLLTLRDEGALPRLMPAGHSAAWQGLDVSVLHHLILDRLLGIGGAERARESHLTYTREEAGALKAVDEGEYQLAFFLNPTLVEEVTAVAANGEKMPQKSTFFYPKLITGLVINPLF
ncbi:Uncharacterized conserved protein, DUF1015 family [Desulfofundulus thermosubterraneus DSM 16057]|uniref:Uncharacterized conserved protein, DUF1015 family n=1 Tax=Desulfofundulus thermosubterraneus DSM 16057 TaxID=1121432 RepID=A0A1M6IWM8_9FIRM|nr:DUF1015 domain-containing protein [Desulfofundulus thermosubterraneus]SHJ38779.1 Uncharacterized conserved protein, DUF1015 family [Desulfofundulus thermosubterraneus DSM 16057]